ncbi:MULTISPECIES: hypothetical protein [Bacillales]|uniref:hypothetical protein n=1 Tax=Bacillales TaxID=1385 RepID=UPI0003702A62|nr:MULTISPECIES: hypothetical protein [Bacillales]
MKKSDLYDPVKSSRNEDLLSNPEVNCHYGRADVVVTSDPIVGVVEMKQSLTLDLID